MKKIYIKEEIVNNYLFNNLIYAGIFLNDETKNLLKNIFKDFVTENLGDNTTFVCHHMTISHISKINDDIKKWCIENYKKEFILEIESIGYSDKACAVKINTDVPTTQNYPHITIAINNNTNGKPVDSNFITKFIKLPNKIKVKGTVDFFYKK
jgi:hypothetical protein